jgi:hypothetical protein
MPFPGVGPLIVGRGSGGSPFTPPSLSGCDAWFRADLGRTMSGSEITSIADQSGALLLPSLDRISTGPTYLASGINGLPDIQWDAGSSTTLAASSLPLIVLGTTAITLFAIFQTSNSAAGRLWGMQYNAFHYLLAVNYSGGFGDGIVSYLTEDASEARSDTPLTDGTPHVAIACWSQSDNTARLYIDGTTPALITAASVGPIAPLAGDVNAAGAGSDGVSVFQTYTGQMPEWGAYDRALDAVPADLAALVGYLKGRAGL